MMKIGILSDTHGYLDQKLFNFFSSCDEIWHAGDIGNLELTQTLKEFKPLIAVYGNIDGTEIRAEYPEIQRKLRDGLNIFMTHIGGYPEHYDRRIRSILIDNPPDIFISGHSHILKVIPDKKLNLLHINPGAAGFYGFHHVRTAVRFNISMQRVNDLEIIELGPRSIKQSQAL